jgi:predicted site-specific integrase-resolvase
MQDFCEAEGVSYRTGWRWVKKGVIQVSRLGPGIGVRVRYADEDEEPR